jgi:hypothetical protein
VKKGYLIALVLVVSALTAFIAMRLLTTERQRVTRVVNDLVARAESRDPAGLCEHLTDDYTDSHGFDRASLRSFLSGLVPFARSVSIEVRDLEVVIDERREGADAEGAGSGKHRTATATFDANVVAEPRDRVGLPPWRGSSKVRLRFRKEEGKWRVYRAEYRLPRLPRP